MSNKPAHKKGLTDKQLITKYDTGGKIDFAKVLKKAAKPVKK